MTISSTDNRAGHKTKWLASPMLGLSKAIFSILFLLKEIICQLRSSIFGTESTGIASGKTVLVTTGRQAKSLHTVRALKEVGATVIVTDYEPISASAVSLASDIFIQLPEIGSISPEEWISNFSSIIKKHKVDMVIPVSSINEVLLLGLAKSKLQNQLPHTTFICPDLQTALLFDDRSAFATICDQNSIPSPEHGVLTSCVDIKSISMKYSDGIILKRIESSVNRSEEIVPILPNEPIPPFINPSPASPWQWQQFITGTEKSVWYLCINGKVTFSACYMSQPDLVHFDPTSVPSDLDISLRKLISRMKLTGQYAFDFIECSTSSKPYVIECNPRSSSILETVSNTPLWGEAFFSVDVTPRKKTSSTGFLYHLNCFPFSNRQDGHFRITDPFPFFAAQVAWPLQAIARFGLTKKSYHHVDVNICKIIVPGPSTPRNIGIYEDELLNNKISMVLRNIPHIEHLLLDASFCQAPRIYEEAKKFGVSVTPFLQNSSSKVNLDHNIIEKNIKILPNEKTDVNDWFRSQVHGETRLLIGKEFCNEYGILSDISWRLVSSKDGALGEKYDLPLHTKTLLHISGSNCSEYYRDLSQMYAMQCIEYLEAKTDDFVNVVAAVHLDGSWSVEKNTSMDYINNEAKRLSFGEAIDQINAIKVDVVIPHLYDYNGLTSFRSLFNIIELPIIGSTGDALALSTHKGRTISVAKQAGVPVAQSEILHPGDVPSIEPPFIVKPTEEDNSMGITLVRTNEEVSAGLEGGFKFGGEVLCEKFIPLGKEVRVALTENSNGEIHILPIVEYVLSKEHPIRTPTDKLSYAPGKMIQAPTEKNMNVQLGEQLTKRLHDAATVAHRSLGCRDYSIFDFRIDPEDNPFMLESCLYCSFSPKSVLIQMSEAEGTSELTVLHRMFDWATARRKICSHSDSEPQKLGMKKV